jgi:hypothetical protein
LVRQVVSLHGTWTSEALREKRGNDPLMRGADRRSLGDIIFEGNQTTRRIKPQQSYLKVEIPSYFGCMGTQFRFEVRLGL